MRYLSLREILEIYKRVMQQSGGSNGIRDKGALEPTIAQPRMSFDGKDLYPTLVDKAVALCFSLEKKIIPLLMVTRELGMQLWKFSFYSMDMKLNPMLTNRKKLYLN